MEKPGCGIVQDLLNSYCDELTGETATEMIEEHLAECPVCQERYKEVKIQREKIEEAEVLRGSKFSEKLKNIRYYLIGMGIGFLLPMAMVGLWLLLSFIRTHFEMMSYGW